MQYAEKNRKFCRLSPKTYLLPQIACYLKVSFLKALLKSKKKGGCYEIS